MLAPGSYTEVQAAFDVEEDGRVKNCRAGGSYSSSLGILTCKLIMERAKYRPAFDKNGRPKPARDTIHITWGRSPARTMVGLTDFGGARPVHDYNWMRSVFDRHPSRRKGGALLRFGIEATGKVGPCAIVAVDGDEKVARRACEALQARGRFSMPVDEKGEPYAVIGSLRFQWAGTEDEHLSDKSRSY